MTAPLFGKILIANRGEIACRVMRTLDEMGIAAAADVAVSGHAIECRICAQDPVAEAVEAAVIGSPYFVVDGQGIFGADRLPQLRWWLSAERT